MTFDIESLDAIAGSEEGTEVPIFNPKTGEKTGLTIRVKGAFASRFQELLSRQRKRDALRAKNPVARAMADEDDDTSQLLADVTLGWDGMVEKGKVIPFGKAEAERIYTAYPVIRGQVLAAALEVANFVKG
jgi:hypothetical protein